MTPAGPGISRLEILRAWPVAVCPNCGCCGGWVAHMEAAGFAVDVVETDDLEPLRKQVGVPTGKASCHTAQVDGYFVEGLVPADDVKRLLREHPSARGITAPGMPIGVAGHGGVVGRDADVHGAAGRPPTAAPANSRATETDATPRAYRMSA